MKNYWYRNHIKAAGGNAAAVYIYGYLTDDRWLENEVSATSFKDDLLALGSPTALEVHINSNGGEFQVGVALYAMLDQLEIPVTAYIDGIVASAATLPVMAADKVIMSDAALLMIHNPMSYASGDLHDMYKAAGGLEAARDAMIAAYQRRVALTDDELIAAMDAETYYTAAEAVGIGFADEVFNAQTIAASLATSKTISSNLKGKVMAKKPDENKTGDDNVIAIEAAKKVKEEYAGRSAAITAKFDAFPQHKDLLIECLADTEVTVEAAADKLLAAIGKEAEAVNKTETTAQTTVDQKDKFRAAAVNAILARVGVEPADAENPLRNISMVDLIKASAEVGGNPITTAAYDKVGVYRQMLANGPAQTTSDFPYLLEDAMHKTLVAAYTAVADKWSRFCDIGSVSDFRAHNRYNGGVVGNLTGYNEAGEFDHGIVSDAEKESNTASTKGKIISLSREMIVNDELGAFVRIVQQLGRAAARSIESDVFTVLLSNSSLGPTLTSDSKTVFHADHNNIGTGGPITPASLDEARQLLAKQKDVGGHDYLDIMAELLLVPVSLRGTALQTVTSTGDPTSGNANSRKANIALNLVDPENIVDTARLSGTRWYLFANPAEHAVIEVAFLNGERNPQIEQEDYFNSAGMKYRVMHDWGVAGVGYRGAVTNAGA